MTTRYTLAAGERIYRFEVPVDDQWHAFALQGDPLHIGCRDRGVVEFWARYLPGGYAGGPKREFRVVGTGQPMPEVATHWGTAVAPGGVLVWHLVERA